MKAIEFIKEFDEGQFPTQDGWWIGFNDHDPPFTMTELRRMSDQGIIEIDMKSDRYRLTMKATRLKDA